MAGKAGGWWANSKCALVPGWEYGTVPTILQNSAGYTFKMTSERANNNSLTPSVQLLFWLYTKISFYQGAHPTICKSIWKPEVACFAHMTNWSLQTRSKKHRYKPNWKCKQYRPTQSLIVPCDDASKRHARMQASDERRGYPRTNTFWRQKAPSAWAFFQHWGAWKKEFPTKAANKHATLMYVPAMLGIYITRPTKSVFKKSSLCHTDGIWDFFSRIFAPIL